MQTTTLQQLIDTPGPFTSVYLDDSSHPADAEKQLELKLRDLREALSVQRAPEGAIAAVETAVRDKPGPVGGGGRAVVAGRNAVVVNERLSAPLPVPVARVSALPYLLPLIRFGEPDLRYVVARVDRAEGRIDAFDEHGREVESEIARGRDRPVREVGGAGSAHHDIREGTGETVRHGVAGIVGAVAEVAQRTGAELVVLVGDIPARRAVHAGLPEAVKAITHEATHETAVPELVAGAKQRRLADHHDRFRAELAREFGCATEGLEKVTAALREANVEVLLVSDPGTTRVFAGTDPAMVAMNEPELKAFGSAEIHERRADEAIPLAAVASRAEVVSIHDELAEGFGAILRHA